MSFAFLKLGSGGSSIGEKHADAALLVLGDRVGRVVLLG